MVREFYHPKLGGPPTEIHEMEILTRELLAKGLTNPVSWELFAFLLSNYNLHGIVIRQLKHRSVEEKVTMIVFFVTFVQILLKFLSQVLIDNDSAFVVTAMACSLPGTKQYQCRWTSVMPYNATKSQAIPSILWDAVSCWMLFLEGHGLSW